jgi:hypothetical protein
VSRKEGKDVKEGRVSRKRGRERGRGGEWCADRICAHVQTGIRQGGVVCGDVWLSAYIYKKKLIGEQYTPMYLFQERKNPKQAAGI